MSKRLNGEGSVYRDGSGRWRGSYLGRRPDGRQVRRYVSAPSRREAAAKIRDLVAARDAGATVISGGDQTVGDWLGFWLEAIATPRVRPSTLNAYRGYLTNRIIPALGAHRLDRLQPEHLEAFYAASLADGLAPATVLQMHRAISRALRWPCNAAGSPATSRPSSTPPASPRPRWNH